MVSFTTDDDHRSKKQRTSKGKQKIEIKKIDNKQSRNVTFSKRRQGLFKKCADFSSLYGSQYAAIAFSIAGKPYVSGYPSTDEVIQRFASDSRDNICVNWWDDPIDGLGLDDLERLKAKLEGLMGEVNSRVNEINRCNDAEITDLGHVGDQFCDSNRRLENVAPENRPSTSACNQIECIDYEIPDYWMENGVSGGAILSPINSYEESTKASSSVITDSSNP